MIKLNQNGSKYSLLSSSQLLHLSVLNPYRSVGVLLMEWLIITIAFAVHLYFLHPASYIIVWLAIGSRMYALYSLLHEGVHYLIFPQRQINDWLSRIFLAWPLFTDLRTMRKHHLAHHQYLQTAEDPEQIHLNYKEFQFPQSRGQLAFTFLKDLTGVNFVKYKIEKTVESLITYHVNKKQSGAGKQDFFNRQFVFRSIYYATIFATATYMGWALQLFLLWIVPYITIYQALNRLRLSTEHFHLSKNKAYQTRTMKLNLVEGFMLSPHNLGYHTEHHLYPSVPFYKLPKLHQQLMASGEYQKNVLVSSSYVEVIKQYAK